MKTPNENEDNDIVPETDADSRRTSDESADESVVAEESAQETIKSLREKLKVAQAEKTEYLTGWQRAKADFINARKRDEEASRDMMKFANERLIVELIPVLDSFEMAMANKEAWEKADKNWRMGVEYIAQQLKKVLEDNGLVEINPLGKDFDITAHEATGYEPVENKSDAGKVIKVIQKGYALNDKVIKVPKVVVGDNK
ncbi:MAG: nucleotide exchange factor GrpE [Patescibacteria group bacterium]